MTRSLPAGVRKNGILIDGDIHVGCDRDRIERIGLDYEVVCSMTPCLAYDVDCVEVAAREAFETWLNDTRPGAKAHHDQGRTGCPHSFGRDGLLVDAFRSEHDIVGGSERPTGGFERLSARRGCGMMDVEVCMGAKFIQASLGERNCWIG